MASPRSSGAREREPVPGRRASAMPAGSGREKRDDGEGERDRGMVCEGEWTGERVRHR